MKSSKQQTSKPSQHKGGHKAQKSIQNLGKTEELIIELPKDIPYDPKKCAKKPLEQLIPTIGGSVVVEIGQHHHFINFYKASKTFIPYYEAPTKIHPDGMIGPYSDFASLVGNLSWKSTFKNSIKQQLKVDRYESQFGIQYVLKTFWLYFYPSKNDPEIHETPESFARKKYNEFVLATIYSSCPHSVKVIDLNFIYLKSENLLISELLETNGGQPITKALTLPITDSKVIYNIFLQNANALNFLEVLNLAHNDIKGDNILIDDFLGKILVKYIDFDIGENQCSTVKNTKVIGPKGYSDIYVAPEILKYVKDKDPLINPGIHSPRKCQAYSVGVLMLQLMGFFASQMSGKDFDKNKLSEYEYKKFWIIYDNYFKTISDPIMRNVLSVVKICLSYKSDDRISGNELIEILSGLERKNDNSIDSEYQSIIERRSKQNPKLGSSANEYSSKLDHKSEESKAVLNVLESENKRLKEEKQTLMNELNESRAQSVEVATDLLNLVNTINISNSKAEKMRAQLKDSKKIKGIFSIILQEVKDLIMNLQNDINSHNSRKAKSELQFKDLNEKLIESENNLKDCFNHLELLRAYEKEHNDFNLGLTEIKRKIQDENVVKISDQSSYSELILSLYEQLQKLQLEKPFLKFKENMPYKNDSRFTGQVNENGIPHGVGLLVYPTLKVRVIGDFAQGEVKNSMGMLINIAGQYCFGRIKDGICQSPIFIIPKYNESRIEDFYLGETKSNIEEGKGKYFYGEGKWKEDYYDGEWKNGNKEGRGKYVYASGDYYDGDWKNDNKEGKGKYVYADGRYYDGDWKHNKKEGKGKYLYASGAYYDGDWKNDKSEGKGKEVYASGACYDGDWKNDNKEGKGKYVYASGNYYDGDWKNGKAEKKGKYVYASGDYYDGDFKNDKKEGKGKYVSANGNYYDGYWKNDKQEGKGKESTVVNGQILQIDEGIWKNGEREGKFLIYFKNQSPYYCEYKEGNKIK